MQLDIFNHSRDTMLRNDVLDALLRRDAPAARSALQVFSAEFAGDETLPPISLLLAAVEPRARAPFADHAAAADERRHLIEAIQPAALRLFGETSSANWLAPLWRTTARRAAPLPFRAEHGEDHAAPLWLRAGDWPAAADAVAGIESWRRIPAPLAWMAEARWRIDGLEASWALLTELAWLSPARFDALTTRIDDPALTKLRKRFDAAFEGDGSVADLAWFPAWILIEKPALQRFLGDAQPSRDDSPERALRLLLNLLTLEREARHHDLIERRKLLRDAHPGLYAAYMQTR